MNRLTDRSKEIPLPCAGNALFWARVHEKLARYEDSGLEPEECAKYAQAEKEGRLLVLPCGDDVTLEHNGLLYKGDHWNPPTLTAFAADPSTRSGLRLHLFSVEDAEKALGGWTMTNADRIRAMTDEEMADEFSYPGCPKQSTPEICRKHTGDCKQCWLDYLKQEVKDNA